jgi:hypothetical protein
MDFQIIVEAVVNHFLNVKICQSFIFYFFPHFAVIPKDFYASLTNCVGVFCETGTVIKKALVPIVRTEKIVTRNKLGRTFSNP